MAADPSGGYWTATPSGAVVTHSNATFLGSPAGSGDRLNQPVVGMAAEPAGHGYWLVASDGGIFAYGDARFYGSTGGLRLNQPIVGMAATTDGGGYWLVASDGGIFSYGDARFYGSTGGLRLNQPIVGMAATPDGGGYWLVASDGGIFSFGDARFFGSSGSIKLNEPIVGMAATPDGGGYWLVASDGGIFTFGDAAFDGSLGGTGATVLGMVVTLSSGGYWLVRTDGSYQSFASSTAASGSGTVGGTPTANQSDMTTPYYEAPISGGPAIDECAPTTPISVTPDVALDSIFDNQTGPGWVAGDIAYSTALPNGQEAFLFGDSLLGVAQADGAVSLQAFVHGSELVGTMPGLSTDIAGSYASPQALLPDTAPDTWQGDATYVEKGDQLIFVNEMAPVPGSVFDTFTGKSGIAVMSLSTGKPEFSSVVPLPTDPVTQWGIAMTQNGGYFYVYGESFNTDSNIWYGMKVARVPVGSSLDTNQWTYWNGSGWLSGESNAVAEPFPLITGIIPLLNGSGYMGIGVGGTFGKTMQIAVTFACSPSGPWSTPQNIYTVPETTNYQDEFAYMASFHPEISSNGQLVASYSTNSLDGLSTIEQNDHQYQPRFIEIGG